MDVCLHIDKTAPLCLLFKNLYGIPIVRRAWLSWKNSGYDVCLFIPPELQGRIKSMVPEARIITYNPDSEPPLQKFTTCFLLNAVYPIKTFTHIQLIRSRSYIVINNDKDIKTAERFLSESVRKDAPTWIAREINKRISIPLSRILTKFPITPNQISLFCLLLAVAAGVFASKGTYVSVVFASFLLLLNSILDGSDGEVARLKFKTSKIGAKLDVVIDFVSLIVFSVGTAIGIKNSTNFLLLGNSLMVLAIISLLVSAYFLRKSPARQLLMEDEEGIYQKTVPKHFSKSISENIYLILFLVGRRDAYIWIIFVISLISKEMVYWFLVFLFLNTLFVMCMSVKRTKQIISCQRA